MKTIKNWIIYQYNSIYNSIYLFIKKNEANRLHKLTGRRYHVVPKDNETLMVVDNRFIDAYNRAIKGKNKKITIKDLLEMSYYSTSVQRLTRQ